MIKIIIWGTGLFGEIFRKSIDLNIATIVCALDSNSEKQGKQWHGIEVYSPSEGLKLEHDIILVAIKSYEEIVNTIRGYGIKSKVYTINNICDACWVKADRKTDLFEIIKKEEDINGTDHKAELQAEVYSKELEYINYDFEKKSEIKILSGELLLKKIIEEKCSVSRFGDGEFELLNECNRPWFQDVDASLTKKLREAIKEDSNGFIVAIADDFGSLEKYTEEAKRDIRYYLIYGRERAMNVLNINRIYYDAYVSRCYLMYKDKGNADVIFGLWKKIWDNRDIVLIEGEYVRTGVGNELFNNAKTVKRIICPSKNAYEKYQEILDSAVLYGNNTSLFLMCLGPTATVLAHDLFKLGYQAIDLGQLDNEYEWYLKGATTRVPISGKGVPELKDSCFAGECDSFDYKKQIVCDLS